MRPSSAGARASGPVLERARWPLVLVALGLLAALHARVHQREAKAIADPAVVDGAGLRSGRLSVEPSPEGLDHLLVLTFGSAAAERQELVFGRVPRIVAGPQAIAPGGAPVPLDVRPSDEGLRVAFTLPKPDAEGDREVGIAFATERPGATYGWGYRALPLPWATRILPPRVPFQLEAKVTGAMNAAEFRCTQIGEDRICVAQPRHRRTIGVPLGPHADVPLRIAFAAAIGVAVSLVMWAIYRRWARLADEMGFREDAEVPTTEQWIDAHRRARASRPSGPARPSREEGDPFEAVALVARGITAVLGILGAVFLVSWFESGLMPIPAPLALSIWSAIAGAVVVLAVGIDRPRPWLALGATVALGVAAFAPPVRWILAGLPPILAAVLMQLTGKPAPR